MRNHNFGEPGKALLFLSIPLWSLRVPDNGSSPVVRYIRENCL